MSDLPVQMNKKTRKLFNSEDKCKSSQMHISNCASTDRQPKDHTQTEEAMLVLNRAEEILKDNEKSYRKHCKNGEVYKYILGSNYKDRLKLDISNNDIIEMLLEKIQEQESKIREMEKIIGFLSTDDYSRNDLADKKQESKLIDECCIDLFDTEEDQDNGFPVYDTKIDSYIISELNQLVDKVYVIYKHQSSELLNKIKAIIPSKSNLQSENTKKPKNPKRKIFSDSYYSMKSNKSTNQTTISKSAFLDGNKSNSQNTNNKIPQISKTIKPKTKENPFYSHSINSSRSNENKQSRYNSIKQAYNSKATTNELKFERMIDSVIKSIKASKH